MGNVCLVALQNYGVRKYSKDLDWWEFKVLVTIVWTSLSSCAHLFMVILLFLPFLISSQSFKVPLAMVEVEVQIFFTLFSRKLYQLRHHHQSVKSTERLFWKFSKKLFKGLSTMFGQWKKWFLAPLKCLFHHFENISFPKK